MLGEVDALVRVGQHVEAMAGVVPLARPLREPCINPQLRKLHSQTQVQLVIGTRPNVRSGRVMG